MLACMHAATHATPGHCCLAKAQSYARWSSRLHGPLPAACRYLWWGHAMTALALLTAWTEPFQMAFVSDGYVLK